MRHRKNIYFTPPYRIIKQNSKLFSHLISICHTKRVHKIYLEGDSTLGFLNKCNPVIGSSNGDVLESSLEIEKHNSPVIGLNTSTCTTDIAHNHISGNMSLEHKTHSC